jgi:hypothetical protein
MDKFTIIIDTPDNVTKEFNSQWIDTKLQVLEKVTFTNSSFRAVSFNWPYIAFSGMSGTVIIINAHESRIFHRVQVAAEESKTSICQTFVTDTHSLFIVTLQQELYCVY